MSFVVDASVAVAAARSEEPSHRAAWVFLRACLSEGTVLVLPALFGVEVAAALSRRGARADAIHAYVGSLLHSQNRQVVLGPKNAQRVIRVALKYRLRGYDAVYAWLSERESLPLVTLDREHLARFPAAVNPADALR